MGREQAGGIPGGELDADVLGHKRLHPEREHPDHAVRGGGGRVKGQRQGNASPRGIEIIVGHRERATRDERGGAQAQVGPSVGGVAQGERVLARHAFAGVAARERRGHQRPAPLGGGPDHRDRGQDRQGVSGVAQGQHLEFRRRVHARRAQITDPHREGFPAGKPGPRQGAQAQQVRAQLDRGLLRRRHDAELVAIVAVRVRHRGPGKGDRRVLVGAQDQRHRLGRIIARRHAHGDGHLVTQGVLVADLQQQVIVAGIVGMGGVGEGGLTPRRHGHLAMFRRREHLQPVPLVGIRVDDRHRHRAGGGIFLDLQGQRRQARRVRQRQHRHGIGALAAQPAGITGLQGKGGVPGKRRPRRDLEFQTGHHQGQVGGALHHRHPVPRLLVGIEDRDGDGLRGRFQQVQRQLAEAGRIRLGGHGDLQARGRATVPVGATDAIAAAVRARPVGRGPIAQPAAGQVTLAMLGRVGQFHHQRVGRDGRAHPGQEVHPGREAILAQLQAAVVDLQRVAVRGRGGADGDRGGRRAGVLGVARAQGQAFLAAEGRRGLVAQLRALEFDASVARRRDHLQAVLIARIRILDHRPHPGGGRGRGGQQQGQRGQHRGLVAREEGDGHDARHALRFLVTQFKVELGGAGGLRRGGVTQAVIAQGRRAEARLLAQAQDVGLVGIRVRVVDPDLRGLARGDADLERGQVRRVVVVHHPQDGARRGRAQPLLITGAEGQDGFAEEVRRRQVAQLRALDLGLALVGHAEQFQVMLIPDVRVAQGRGQPLRGGPLLVDDEQLLDLRAVRHRVDAHRQGGGGAALIAVTDRQADREGAGHVRVGADLELPITHLDGESRGHRGQGHVVLILRVVVVDWQGPPVAGGVLAGGLLRRLRPRGVTDRRDQQFQFDVRAARRRRITDAIAQRGGAEPVGGGMKAQLQVRHLDGAGLQGRMAPDLQGVALRRVGIRRREIPPGTALILRGQQGGRGGLGRIVDRLHAHLARLARTPPRRIAQHQAEGVLPGRVRRRDILQPGAVRQHRAGGGRGIDREGVRGPRLRLAHGQLQPRGGDVFAGGEGDRIEGRRVRRRHDLHRDRDGFGTVAAVITGPPAGQPLPGPAPGRDQPCRGAVDRHRARQGAAQQLELEVGVGVRRLQVKGMPGIRAAGGDHPRRRGEARRRAGVGGAQPQMGHRAALVRRAHLQQVGDLQRARGQGRVALQGAGGGQRHAVAGGRRGQEPEAQIGGGRPGVHREHRGRQRRGLIVQREFDQPGRDAWRVRLGSDEQGHGPGRLTGAAGGAGPHLGRGRAGPVGGGDEAQASRGQFQRAGGGRGRRNQLQGTAVVRARAVRPLPRQRHPGAGLILPGRQQEGVGGGRAVRGCRPGLPTGGRQFGAGGGNRGGGADRRRRLRRLQRRTGGEGRRHLDREREGRGAIARGIADPQPRGVPTGRAGGGLHPHPAPPHLQGAQGVVQGGDDLHAVGIMGVGIQYRHVQPGARRPRGAEQRAARRHGRIVDRLEGDGYRGRGAGPGVIAQPQGHQGRAGGVLARRQPQARRAAALPCRHHPRALGHHRHLERPRRVRVDHRQGEPRRRLILGERERGGGQRRGIVDRAHRHRRRLRRAAGALRITDAQGEFRRAVPVRGGLEAQLLAQGLDHARRRRRRRDQFQPPVIARIGVGHRRAQEPAGGIFVGDEGRHAEAGGVIDRLDPHRAAAGGAAVGVGAHLQQVPGVPAPRGGGRLDGQLRRVRHLHRQPRCVRGDA